MASSKSSRRKFISGSLTAGLAFTIIPRHVLGGKNFTAPSDRVRVANIGLGSQGNKHVEWFNSLADVEIAALCDVDQLRLEKTRSTLISKNPSLKLDTYTDFRKILERNDIDAISCATPDHWHALIAIMAFESGKDVYGEKPLCYSVKEGRAMLSSLEKNKRVFQLGTQARSGENYPRVTEIIQSGKLGKIHTVRLWKGGGSPGLGFPPNEKPPETLDWNMWLGPAPYEEYTRVRCHGSYRYFLDYSGGVYADFWCHIADVMFMSLHPKGLTSIDSRGDRPHDGIADAPRWIDVDYKFDGLDVFWTTKAPDVYGADKVNKSYQIGACFEGTNGSMVCDYNNRFIKMGNELLDDLTEVPKTYPRNPLPYPTGHQDNFIKAVKTRIQPDSNLAYARELTTPMLLSMISFKLKRKLSWDPVKEQVVGDDAANYLLSRNYRAPWSLPK